MTENAPLRALALVCSLKPSPAPSSSELIARQVLEELGKHGVTGDVVRVVDHDVKPGVEVDMGEGDAWPAIREQLMAADILIVSTPTWVGHMSSVAQRVLERLDGELSETDDSGRPLVTGKVAVTAVVGNEDGAHKITADLMQAPQRHRLHHPGPGRHVLERRGDGQPRLPRPGRDPRGGRLDHRHPRGERRAPGAAAQGVALPVELSRSGGQDARGRRSARRPTAARGACRARSRPATATRASSTTAAP